MNGSSTEPSESPVLVDKVIRSRRKTLALEITHDGILIVRAPYRATRAHIDELVREKRAWILRKIAETRKRPAPSVHEYREGEIFFFLGGSYPLTVVDDRRKAIRRLDRLYVSRDVTPDLRAALRDWYMQEALVIIRDRCAYFSMVNGFLPASVSVTDARRRWGSCTSEGRLNFSWRLVQAPMEIVDYVVVHELVHLRHHDHSRKFWSSVKEILPDFERRRKWLRQNEQLLMT